MKKHVLSKMMNLMKNTSKEFETILKMNVDQFTTYPQENMYDIMFYYFLRIELHKYCSKN